MATLRVVSFKKILVTELFRLVVLSICVSERASGQLSIPPSQKLDQTKREILTPYSRDLPLPGTKRVAPPAIYNFLFQPPVPLVPIPLLRPEISISLEARFAVNQIGPYRYKHRSYNGGLVGPPIRVRPGDSLRIQLINNLPREPIPEIHIPDEPHGFNDTNLHTHGLHVSPSLESDNVLIAIQPGEDFNFEIDVPPNQPPGTFWYHPHKHGAVALQMTSGMCGPIIVEGGIDDAPELRGVHEQILVFQQFILPESSREDEVIEITPADVYQGARPVARTTLVNGELYPTVRMRPGEIQRWRFIHAGLESTLDLRLTDHTLHEFALDGLNTGKRQARGRVELQPGQRSDVLVQAATQTGEHYLKNEVLDPTRAVRHRTVPDSFLMRVVVEGEPVAMQLPGQEVFQRYVPALLDPIKDGDLTGPRREIVMNVQDFSMNGHRFNPDRIDVRTTLGAVEEWTISSFLDLHPFHLHVNPFQVWTRDRDTGQEGWVWRDTAFLRDGESTRIRIRFASFSGLTVMHCHNLDHEDRGMMSTLLIDDPKDPWPIAPPRETSTMVEKTAWAGLDSAGLRVTSGDDPGAAVLLVLHRGLRCSHCAAQLSALAMRESQFARHGIRLVAIGPEADATVVADFQKRHGEKIKLLIDPELETFRNFGCEGTPVKHGTFLIDPRGRVRWQAVGESPEMNIDKLLAAAAAVAPVISRETLPTSR